MVFYRKKYIFTNKYALILSKKCLINQKYYVINILEIK